MKRQPERWTEYRERLVAELLESSDSSDVHLPVSVPRERVERDAAAEHLVVSHGRTAIGLGALPVVDLVAVTVVQARMLRDLAALHGTTWSRERIRDFLARLGPGIAAGILGHTLGRTVVKFVPVIGQSAGAAWGARSAGTATYAIGQAAHYYLTLCTASADIDTQALRRLHREAGGRATKALGDSVSPSPGD